MPPGIELPQAPARSKKRGLSLLLSLPAAMFYCVAAASMGDLVDAPGAAPAVAALLAKLLLPGTVALWILADARQRGRSLSYDAGAFFFLAWSVLAPIYLFSTRGWRAFAPLGCFFLLYFAAIVCASVPYFLLVMRQ